MKKRLFFSILLIVLAIVLSFSYTYATNNMVKDIRNIVGGAENVVENTAKDMVNGVREGTNKLENFGNNMTDDMKKDTNNTMLAGDIKGNNNDNNEYSAQRTSTNATNSTFLGMSSNMWTFIIMGILGIAIIALVWYYGKQFESKYNNDDNNY